MKNLTEGIDFYYNETGCIVLTAKYHQERGYCCGYGCKHCPYDYENVPPARRKLLLEERKQDEQKKKNKKGGKSA